MSKQVANLEVHYLGNREETCGSRCCPIGSMPTAKSTRATTSCSLWLRPASIDSTNGTAMPLGAAHASCSSTGAGCGTPARTAGWVGRKRGKLQELNALLRIDDDWLPDQPGSAHGSASARALRRHAGRGYSTAGVVGRLVGTIAHPLNQPSFDPRLGRVTDGYGLLQPRITPTLPAREDASFFQRTFAGSAGIDPYATAVSDVYQDLFQEGSFTGKGIYDVDAFASALHDRVPDNTLLSHDLFEGVFARRPGVGHRVVR